MSLQMVCHSFCVICYQFVEPMYRQYIVCKIPLTNCYGLTLVACVAFRFSIPLFFVVGLIPSDFMFLFFISLFIWEWILCSPYTSNVLTLLVAAFTFGPFIHKPNIKTLSMKLSEHHVLALFLGIIMCHHQQKTITQSESKLCFQCLINFIFPLRPDTNDLSD